jgi:NAD(P)-dependent dehydrogenase (short-subunit alcohol dehydrogenase family)
MTGERAPISFASHPDAVWLITGCSSGFGKALSALVAQRGFRLVATARNPADLGHLPDDDPRIVKVALDVTKPGTIKAAIADAIERFRAIDVVVNNAGIGVVGPLEDITEEQTRLQFEINVFGVLNVVRATAPLFRAQRRGLYINFASMAGERSYWSLGVYAASKFAVEGLSEAIVQEMTPHGVSALIVEPGPFDTEWFGKNAVWAPEHRDRYPDTWAMADGMKQVYGDRAIVGDPSRAAEAILAAIALDPPPLRLPLHEYALASIRDKIAALETDLALTQGLSLAIHYPEGQASLAATDEARSRETTS